MPHCITERQKKQPEYIAAMNKYNMSSDDLELILYKWQNLEDNQEAMSKGELPFVPDSFIEENYFPKTQQVQDEAFVKLWEKEYKNPKIFNTLQEAQQEADRVSKLFGNGSVVVRNTKDNKYKVVVAEQLLTDKQTKTLNQFYDKRDISRITDSSIVLSPHDSEDFNKQVSSGYYPQMFTIKTRDGLMTLTKINNRKRSRQYKVVSSDGKVIAEKLKLYTDEQYYKYQKSIEDSYDKFNKYNEGRSLTFKTFLEMPSKGLFKKMAKEWLKEAGRVDDLFIDIKLIDEFVNKFSDDFWKHVITYITSPQTKFIGTYANVLGVTYNNSNSLINKGWIFNYTIPKQGLIDELEKAFNIKIDQQELFGKKINRSLKYNDLEDIVRQYLARKLYISEKDHIKAYAKYHNLSITEVEATVEKLKENIKTDGKLEDSKQLREIIEFGAIDAVIAEIKSKYDNDLIEYMEKRGLKIPKQAASIVFNRQYLSDSDTKINRLATIFHEPFHAIEFLAQDSEELQKIYSAYDQLINTSFGKTLIEKIKDFNTVYDENTLKSEVLANLFSVLMMPEEMKQRFLQQSEDNQMLGVFLQKEINAILNSDHTIKYLQSKTVAEEKTILKTVTKEERETLPILKQIWNNFINLLQKYFNFVNESWKFAEKTNVIKETFAETQTTTHTIYEEIIKQDEQFEAFEEALNTLNQYLLDVINVNISNQGYNEFEKSSYSVSQSQSQQQFVPQNTYNGVTENNSSNNATTSKIIAYTPKGKERQTYTIVGNKIYNKDGVEVFKEDGVDRNKIFANLAVQEGRAVVVTYNERQYVVNNRNQIISVTTGELMKWNENDEDRNDILNKAQTLFQQQKLDILKQDLGGGEQATTEIKDAIKVAKKGMSFEEALAGQEAFFTKEEQDKIKQGLNGKNLQVMSVSRKTDPVFFSEEIVRFLKNNAKKDLSDPTRITVIEIWSKHDGLPIVDILEACKKYRVAPIVSFSITGLGGTALEGGVMKYKDMLQKVGELIQNKTLNATTTTIRIDPILPGVTNMDDIRDIVQTAKSLGIKKFVTSLVQSYGYLEGTKNDRKVISGINNALATEGKTYDWDKYYGRDRNNKINFKPKQQYIDEIGKVLLELDKDPEITIQTCAFGIKGLKFSACLDPMIIERIVGVDVIGKDGTYDRDTSRPECMCYGCHGDFFKVKRECFSSCAYCYAAHSGDSKFNYYNEDGTLKDDDFTRTSRESKSPLQQQNEVQQPTQEKDNETTNPNIVVNSPLKQATFEAQVEKLNSEDKAYFENQKTEYEAQEKVLGFDNEFTPTEIDELCRDVAFNLSYILQQDASVLKQAFDLSESEDDIRNMSSLQLAKKIGLKNLFFYCKETMFETKDDWSFEMIDQADILKQDDVFNVLLLKANPTFISIEGWGFKFNNDSSVEVNENVDLSESDNFNESQNTADVAEVKGNTQEAWQIDSNTLNVISTMSQRVKQQLAQCFKLDKNGDYILSKWGVPQRLSVTEATAQILTWTRGAINLSHMIKLLKKQVDNNMWLQPLLDRLTDNSGNESQFQSQFFTSFAKHHQNYSVTTLEDGRFAVKPLNDNTTLSDAKKTISSLYKIGEHPLFTSNGEINATNYKQLVEINDLLTHTLYNDENKQIIANNLTKAANLLGFTTTEEDVLEILDASTYKQMVANSLQYIVSTIANQRNKATWEPFSSNPKKNGIINNIGKFITPLTAKLDAITIHSFFNKGKMYQSDVQPSYLSDLMDKFNLSDEIDPSNPTKDTPFTEFIWNEYAKYKQFRDSSKDTGNHNKDILIGWKSPLLKALVTNPTARRLFSHKVSLSFNNKSYMDSDTDSQAMLSNEYLLSIISEYFATTEKGELLVPAWFRIPMMSNKASAEYIQMLSYRGADYKDNIVNDLKTFFDYELSRMQTIMLRNKQKGDFGYIENLEKNGKRFCFLPSLNVHLDNDTRLGVLIKNKLNKGLSQEEEVELNSLALKAIRDDLEEKAQNTLQNMEQDGFLEVAASRINGLNQDNVRDRIENFIWNDFLASKNILQFTIGDIAQYKNTVELQKRLKELQAPGIKPNVQAVDFDNNPVTDGFNRTIYLTDFEGEIVKSNIIENVRTVFDKKLATIEDKTSREYQIAKETYDNIIKQFEKDINVADGQAYVSISAMRKKMIMFGKWSKADEDFYQKFKSGNWDHTDFQRHFNPLKPFVYSQIGHSSGVEDAPISEFKMGVQYKNSEYLLMYANAIALQSDRPNILKALADIMEDSAEKNPTKGIDNIQFVSAVKTGITGVVDIISLLNEPNGEKAAKEYVESLIYNEDGSYNKEAIQEVPFEDYKIQQEIPDHFMDHFQAHGSQIRMIIPSDLDVNSVFTYTDGISQVEKNGEEFRKEYEKNIAENINESIDEVISALNLNGTPLEKNIALSRILKREIISSARYGMDLYMACSLNENGEFRIPLTDPIQSKRIEQLLNSIIKNRINKQEIAGGPVVQVSNFGVSRQLNVVFKSKDGSLLKTLKEYTNEGHTEQEWVEYVKENQSGISHYEVFVSATYKKLYQDFMDEKGNLDVKAIEKLNPDLLKMIGYRIPTEDKYSTFPCKIVGFLPSEAGEAIMLPYEITLITGSDFDIDKMYLMIKEINIKRKKNVRDLMYNSLVESRREYLESKGKKITHEEKQKINEEVDMFLSNPSKMTQVEGLSKSLGEWYRNNAFEATVPLSGRSYRNNKIVDMTWSVLTHPDIASQVLKPGGFEEQKNVGYSAEALRLGYTLEEVQSKSTSELKDMCAGNKDLTYIDTQIEFYQQNSAAASLLPIFATQKIAHAALAGNKYSVDIAEVCSADKPFYLCGQRFGDLMYIDEQKNILGQYIGNDLGSCVAASADAVKDPVFNYMNINNNTVNVLSAMIRMGIPFKTAAMVLSSKIVGDCLSTFGINAISLKTSDRKSFIKIVSDKLDELRKSAVGTKESTKLDYEDLTLEELYDAVTHNKANVDYKILNTVLRFNKIAKVLKTPTAIAKLNSISNAVGPLVIDNLVANNNLLQPMGGLYNRNGEELTIDDIFLDHPILHGFYQAYNIASNLFSTISVSGSTGFIDLLRKIPYSEVLYHNRKLLNQFSDFYKSYLALIGGVVNDSELNYYINMFPAEFNKMIRKDSAYKDNFLIQSIRYTTLNSGNVVLNIDSVGVDKETESKLSSAWLDLYKQDEDLAIDLFKYSFFRGGVGFSPKTIMKLLPIQLKEKIENYVQTFRRLPSYIAYESNIADQFVQNYYKDNKLVPVVDKEKIHSNERYIALEPDSNRKFSAGTYVKVKNEKGWVLYKIVDLNIDSNTKKLINYVIEEIPILGNNNEYLEIALHDITKPLSEFKSQESIEPASDVKNNQETEENDDYVNASRTQITDTNLSLALDMFSELNTANQEKIYSLRKIKENDSEKFEEIKPKMIEWFKNKAQERGITINEIEAEQMLNLFC